jgi:hypothetical protein
MIDDLLLSLEATYCTYLCIGPTGTVCTYHGTRYQYPPFDSIFHRLLNKYPYPCTVQYP